VNAIGKPVEIVAGSAIPKLLQIDLPKPPEFKESLEAVKSDYVEAKAAELLQAQAQRLADEARNIKDLTKAAQKEGVPAKTSQAFKRDGTPAEEIGSAPEFTAAAFNLPVGGVSGPIAISGGKQVAVLQVQSRTPFNEEEFLKQKAQLREMALNVAREAYLSEYIRKITDGLEKAGKIRINTQAIEQATGSRY